MNELKIRQAINGWVLEYEEEIEGKPITQHIAVEDDPKGRDAFTTQKLLLEILEHFGLMGSKHDFVRIRVIVEDQNGNEIEE